MADDVLTRNSADELALRVAQSSGDTGTNKDDVYTRDSQGRLAVRTVGGSGGGGGADYSAEIKALENAVSVLATSVNLTTEVGGKTTVALGNLTAMDIDGRPSYKQAGATVFADNGVVGIIDSVDSTSAIITTVQYQAEQRGGSSEIVWDKTKTVYVEAGDNNLGWAYAELNLGVLSDGKYSFYIATRANTSEGNNGPEADDTIDGRFVYSIMKVEFIVDGDGYRGGRCYAIPPFVGLFNIGPNIYGPNGYSHGRPKLYRTDDGETLFYFDEPGMFVSDVAMYVLESGNYDLWKVSKLVKEDGTESSIEFSRIYFDSQGNDRFYYPYYQLGYMPLVNVYEHAIPYTSSNFSSSNFEGDDQQYIFIDGVIPDEVGLDDSNMGGNAFIGNRKFYMINKNTRDVCILDLSINPSYIKAQVVYCTGVFDVEWKLAIKEEEYMQFTQAWVYADGFKLNDCIVATCFYGNNGAANNGINMFSGEISDVKVVSFDRFKKPTSTSSEYMLYHENGLVEMGGIVSINETLQPDVALGNVPVVFHNELGNANFVPTITVMTDGTFKKVMADVANPTTTGFDLCVRNVDTEEVSGIKIAWKVVGTKK